MKILIIGGAGQLGQDTVKALEGHTVYSPSHQELNISNREHVDRKLEELNPDVLINTAAFNDVPKCEIEQIQSYETNSIGPYVLAQACRAKGTKFVHISTDYVFDGEKGEPYLETDQTRPLMVYGASKLAGEHMALSNWEKTFVVRTSGLFGVNPCRAKPGGRNFVETMLHLARTRPEVTVVNDQYCCPTYTKDLGVQLAALAQADVQPGVYHAVTPSGCSWFDFAKMIFELGNADVKLTPVSSANFPVPFKRPDDSRLSNNRLEQAGLCRMKPRKQALADYFKNRTVT